MNRLTGVWAIIGTQNGNYDSQATLQNWDPGEELLNVLRHFPLYDMPIPPSPSLNIFCILDIKSWLQRAILHVS